MVTPKRPRIALADHTDATRVHKSDTGAEKDSRRKDCLELADEHRQNSTNAHSCCRDGDELALGKFPSDERRDDEHDQRRNGRNGN